MDRMSRRLAQTATVLGLAVAASLFPGAVSAQPISSPYRFVDEGRAGGIFAGIFHADPGTAEVGPRPGQVFGGRFTVRATGPLEFELEAGIVNTDRVVWEVDTLTTERRPAGEAGMTLLHLNGSLRFDVTGPRTFHGFMPFVAAGAGIVSQVSDRDLVSARLPLNQHFRFGTSFAAHAGAGIEWYAFGRLALRLDGRAVLYRFETPSGILSAEPTLPDRQWVQNYVLTAGLSYRF